MSSYIDFPNYDCGTSSSGGTKTNVVTVQPDNKSGAINGSGSSTPRSPFHAVTSLRDLKDYNAINEGYKTPSPTLFRVESSISNLYKLSPKPLQIQPVKSLRNINSLSTVSGDEEQEEPPPSLSRVATQHRNLNMAGNIDSPIDDGNKPSPPDGFEAVTTLAVRPGNELELAKHLLGTVEHIQKLAPDCLEWDIFHLEAADEILLIEQYLTKEVAERYRGYTQNAMKYAEEKGWLNGEPDVRVQTSPGGFALRRWSP